MNASIVRPCECYRNKFYKIAVCGKTASTVRRRGAGQPCLYSTNDLPMNPRKIRLLIFGMPCFCFNLHAQEKPAKREIVSVRGWNILTDNPQEIARVMNAAGRYDINHLQLSHSLIMD